MDNFPKPQKIHDDYKNKVLTKRAAVEKLILLIDTHNDNKIRIKAIELLQKIRYKGENVLKCLESCLISDRGWNIGEAAVKVLFHLFPKKSINAVQWLINEGEIWLSPLFVQIFDAVWWSENKDWEKLRKELYFQLSPDIENYVCEGVVHKEAIILALIEIFCSGKLEKIDYDEDINTPDTDHLFHYKINKDGHVLGIYLTAHSDPDEVPFLPENIARLKFLEEIVMIQQSLERIPESIGEINNLKKIYLGFNCLESIPESIGKLHNLEELDLSENMIKKIPWSIGSLGNLKYLSLYNNKIENIPDSIVNLTSLEEIDLSYNKIKKIPSSIKSSKIGKIIKKQIP